jgi:hypothetical protein
MKPNSSPAPTAPAPLNDELLEQLRDVLLRDERHKIDEIRRILNTESEMDLRVGGIIDVRIEAKLEDLRNNFKQDYGSQVTELVDHRIEYSRDELINVLYPVMGKMIRKFVEGQFQALQESIDQRVTEAQEMFTWKSLKRRFFGISNSEDLLQDMKKAQIDEVYLIQKGTGFLLGSLSQSKTLDQDVIAGMLTAIKAFAEDAFQKEGQELEFIEWNNYKIVIQNSHTYYFAVALSGILSTIQKDHISNTINTFIEKELSSLQFKNVDSNLTNRISEKLAHYFHA